MAAWQTKVEGKVVVITGASSGIGAGIARLLAAEGARVVLGARRTDRLATIVGEIQAAGGQARAVTVDVTRPEQVQALVAAAVEQFGRIDVMINNAGIVTMAPLDAGKVEEWSREIDVNIKGVVYGIAAAFPHFRAQNSGHLINVASVAGYRVFPGLAVYCGTKFAVRAITEGFRQEAGPTIRSTIISPGAVESELSLQSGDHAATEEMKAVEGIAIPAEAIAQAVLYALEQPPTVAVNELLVRPTAQVP